MNLRYSEMNPNGKTLVISFEGNAGFYEIGMMITPLEAGYSVLGWNHPGFGGSTVSIGLMGNGHCFNLKPRFDF